jgi:glucose/arabinose dehydrogenase
MKRSILLFLVGFVVSFNINAQVVGSRMNELFIKTDLINQANQFNDPWEITYGQDDSLWITESKGYKVYKVAPFGPLNTKRMILDIANGATFSTLTPVERTTFNVQFVFTSKNPQGGLAGLALHPDFMKSVSPKKYVYVSYIYKFIQDLSGVDLNGDSKPDSAGIFYQNQIVRFTYNPVTGLLGNPVSICDTIPGSSDHNSQRMIIAPVNGVNYLFYAAGDMGSGQFGNAYRANNAQKSDVYEGKILRFNLEPDLSEGTYDQWIPNDNPFNTTTPAWQSAVWVTGIRNNQGFAYDSVRNILYGSSHGPHSDDEVNVIERARNYGHPLVEGYSWDENYNSSSAGFPGSSVPVIGSETANALAIGSSYKNPIFSGYPSTHDSIYNIYTKATGYTANKDWPSEGWSGLGLYNYSVIPGWKNSLVMSGLKWGRLIRTKLYNTGDSVLAEGGRDTTCYFDSNNRFRDIAFSPSGKDIFVIMDKSAATSGPSANNPSIPACAGCLQRYSFIGYNTVSGTSGLPNHIEIAPGKSDACENVNTVNINANNNNVWVPITDTLGNIVAEIKANANNLGNVTSSIFVKSGSVREFGYYKTLYANRSITISPQNAPGSAVYVRLYLTNNEYIALKDGINSVSQPSGITSITNVGVFKNNETPCSSTMSVIPSSVTLRGTYTRTGTTGYAIEVSVTGFSTFYFARLASALPLHLLSFKGTLSDEAAKLQWLTENENATKSYTVERSANGKDFDSVGIIASKNAATKFTYYFADADVRKLSAPIVYYRLRMTDINGQYSYSDVVKLNVNLIAGTITVRPNPVISETTVDIYSTNAEKARWILTDINGKTVMQRSLNLKKGENSLNINLSSLPAGMYYLKVSGNTINQSTKLQKL